MTSENIVIVAGKRSPIGSHLGQLSLLSAPEIAAQVIRGLLQSESAKVKPSEIQEVILGEVLTAGVGQAPARQAAIFGGIPNSVPCTTVNKVCGSGLKALVLAKQALQLGQIQVALAGGMESMSRGPYLIPSLRAGARLGHSSCIDSVVNDGLWDCYNQFHMGAAGELCAKEFQFSRSAQDDYAITSYQRALEACKNGHFAKEIVPIAVTSKKETRTFDLDEEPFKSDLKRIPDLKPVFDSKGTITAANASSINDGAAVCLLMTESLAKSKGFPTYFRITHATQFAQAPEWFTTAPVGAMKELQRQSGVPWNQIDTFEINEAFSVVPMAAMRELQIPHAKVNPRGGAVALGHPIGCSGARIVVTLMNHLNATEGRWGVASLCIGGGEAIAALFERVEV